MIKIEYVSHYEAGFFAPGTHVEPSPEIIKKLLNAFDTKKFLPTTISLMKIEGKSFDKGLQLMLITKKEEWKIDFEPHRFLVSRFNVPGVDMCSDENFIHEAKDIFSILLDIFPFKGTRLSYATKGLANEMPEKLLQGVNSRLLNLPNYYLQNPPWEWTTRNVANEEIEFNNKKEIINVIMDVNRIQGSLKLKDETIPIDRVEIGFDINTFHKNIDQRFSARDMDAFLIAANEISKKIAMEIGGLLDE